MAAPPTRAEIFQALAQDPDIPALCRRFGITPEELSRLFREAAALFQGEKSVTAEKPAVAGTWRLQVDGGSRGNPGPAGAGAVLFDPAGEKKGEVSQYLGETTNNVAEYQALLLGLKMALDLGVKNLEIFADSQLVVQQLKGAYQVKTPTSCPSGGKPGKPCKSSRPVLSPTLTGPTITRPTVWPGRPLTGISEKGNMGYKFRPVTHVAGRGAGQVIAGGA